MKKNENFKNIKPKLKFSSELEFDKFIEEYRMKMKIDEVLSVEELEEMEKEKQINSNGKRKLF